MGMGRVDGAGTCRWGPGRMDGAWDAWEGAERASLSWWSTRGRHIFMVGKDAGGTMDMPVCVVHNEGERQDTDKGGYARRGMYAESLRVDVLGFCGGWLRRTRVAHGRGREAGRRTR